MSMESRVIGQNEGLLFSEVTEILYRIVRYLHKRRLRHHFDDAELAEMIVERERPLHTKTLHDRVTYAVCEAPLLVGEPVEDFRAGLEVLFAYVVNAGDVSSEKSLGTNARPGELTSCPKKGEQFAKDVIRTEKTCFQFVGLEPRMGARVVFVSLNEHGVECPCVSEDHGCLSGKPPFCPGAGPP